MSENTERFSADYCMPWNKPGTNYKIQAIKAAKELYYGKDVVKRLKEAKSDAEVACIMNTARHQKYGE